ncbi:MAG: hypothetical protein U9N54_12445, partial [candidate division Zixibacteria bacterium]|nr:hypothetical protein [candidate division Zixibacteria bacterium]
MRIFFQKIAIIKLLFILFILILFCNQIIYSRSQYIIQTEIVEKEISDIINQTTCVVHETGEITTSYSNDAIYGWGKSCG